MTQPHPLPPILPENRDAEQALLGALMINNKLFDQIAGICSAQHFASAMHARLFTQLVVLITTGKKANPVTLKSFGETDNALQASGGKTYLVQLAKRGMVLDRAGALESREGPDRHDSAAAEEGYRGAIASRLVSFRHTRQ